MSIPSSFDVSGTSGALGAFLATDYGGTGLFSVLGSATNSGAAATATALGAGGLTTAEHNVVEALGAGGTASTAIPWNSDGTEPTLLTQLRNYGWIRLVGRTGGTSDTASGKYVLTPVGQAIYKRTGGGVDGSSALSNASLNSGAATDTAAGLSSSQLTTLNSLLSGLSGISSLAGSLGGTSGSTTNSGTISTGATGSLVNVIA